MIKAVSKNLQGVFTGVIFSTILLTSGVFVGLLIVAGFLKYFVLLLVFILVLVVAVFRLHWLIAIFLFFSPLQYVLVSWLPAPIDTVWRDLLFLFIMAGWGIQMIQKQEKKYASRYSLYVFVLILWVLGHIIYSETLATGVLGFRTLLRYLPIYFPISYTLSGSNREKRMSLYLNSFLVSSILNAFFAAGQHLFINLLNLFSLGTPWLDPIRSGELKVTTVHLWERLGSYRSLGFFPDPSYLGHILIAGISIVCTKFLWPIRKEKKVVSFMRLSLIVVFGVAILGTYGIFTIGTSLLVVSILISFRITNNRLSYLIIVGLFIVVGIFMVFNIGGLSWVNYDSIITLSGIKYLPNALETFNVFGRGLATSGDLARRFGVPSGPLFPWGRMEATAGWFFFDEAVGQIGLMGVIFWVIIWWLFIHRGFYVASFTKINTLSYRNIMASTVITVGLFMASLHYGTTHVAGADILLPTAWAYIGLRNLLSKYPLARQNYDK